MAPIRPRLIVKSKLSDRLRTGKTQNYYDPSSRGPGSHAIRCLAWNPLGTLIATGSVDRTLRVWNPERPNVRYSTDLKGHEAGIEKVAFNPAKDAELASISSDGVLKIWDVRTKACVNEIKTLGSCVSMVWHPDGTSIIVNNKTDKIFVIDPLLPTPIAEFQQDVQTNEIAFCWSGDKVFVATGEGRVKILSYPNFQPLLQRPWEDAPFTLNGHTSSALSVSESVNARYIASGGSDSIIALWDTKDWICRKTLTEMTGPVRSISFSWCGCYIVGGSDEGNSLEIAHVEDGDYVHSLKIQSPSPVVAWHPIKYHLAYADKGGLQIMAVGPEPDRKPSAT